MNNASLINQTSGGVEYYTPSHIIEAARSVMGSIDLDPASCAKANETVQAAEYYTEADNGLMQDWYGNVWLNHPFSRKTNSAWIDKAVSSWTKQPAGIVKAITLITFASTSEAWFQPLYSYPQCYLSPRLNYIGQDGEPVKGVTKGSVVTYMGWDVKRFIEVLGELGSVMVPPAFCKIVAGCEWGEL